MKIKTKCLITYSCTHYTSSQLVLRACSCDPRITLSCACAILPSLPDCLQAHETEEKSSSHIYQTLFIMFPVCNYIFIFPSHFVSCWLSLFCHCFMNVSFHFVFLLAVRHFMNSLVSSVTVQITTASWLFQGNILQQD